MNAPAIKAPEPLGHNETAKLTFRITALSVGVSIVLTLLKLIGWWRGGSTALLASLADSALDVLAALATFVAVRVAATPPDEQHRFGHGKAEAFSSLLQGALVFASAALIGREALMRLIHPTPVAEEGWAFLIMLISTAATLGLVAAQTKVLERARSVAVSGDRAHYVADLASNIAAVAGVGLARLTHDARFDAGAGLFVALWLLWGAVKVFRDATDHLMDRELATDERQKIVDAVLADENIRNVHELKTHASGPRLHIQMHVDLDPDQTLEAAHEIVDAAEARVREAFPTADVIIHPDPEGRAETHEVFAPEAPSPNG
jgi:cation diffusion facilitator family transporter